MSDVNFNLPLEELVDKPPEGKECKNCNEWKYFSEFWIRREAADGYQLYCKVCQKAKQEVSRQRSLQAALNEGKGNLVGTCKFCDKEITSRMKSIRYADFIMCGQCHTFYWTNVTNDPLLYLKVFTVYKEYTK